MVIWFWREKGPSGREKATCNGCCLLVFFEERGLLTGERRGREGEAAALPHEERERASGVALPALEEKNETKGQLAVSASFFPAVFVVLVPCFPVFYPIFSANSPLFSPQSLTVKIFPLPCHFPVFFLSAF